MKHFFIIFTSVFVSLYSCSQTHRQTHTAGTNDTSARYISQIDAEKILGQSASLTESSTEQKDNAVKYRYTYTANDSVVAGNRTGHLYCLFEVYKDEASAKKTFADILSGNQSMPNLKKINIGDEALQHSDNENFDMVIVRKGNKIIRLKVNKLTGLTSAKELLVTAGKITNVI
jgi:hypothetical protein